MLTAPFHIKGPRHNAASRTPGNGRHWIVDSGRQSRGMDRGAVGPVVQECAEMGRMILDDSNVADRTFGRRFFSSESINFVSR